MLSTIKTLLSNQYGAAFSTVAACVDRCPVTSWDLPIGNYPFSQVVFHTLFFADYYLGPHAESFRQQLFHQDNREFFADYEQLEYRTRVGVYDRPSLQKYLVHCRHKAMDAVDSETEQTLAGPSGFERRDFSRGELHVYNIRHIQHHSAQLVLRLRTETGLEIPWFGSGWQAT